MKQEELSALKHQNLPRALAFYPLRDQDNIDVENRIESDQPNAEESLGCESKESPRVSSKQVRTHFLSIQAVSNEVHIETWLSIVRKYLPFGCD